MNEKPNAVVPFSFARGFTIIELMITIALIAVVAGIAVPGFQGFIERNQLATAMNDLASALSIARSEAIKRKQTVAVCPRGTNDECQGNAYESGLVVKVVSTGEVIWVNEGLPRGYTMRGNGGIAEQVRYRYDGRPLSFGSVTLCRNAQADTGRKLIINRTGRIRMEKTPNGCGVSSGG